MLTSKQEVWVFGSNKYGQCGVDEKHLSITEDIDEGFVVTPRRILMRGVQSISVGAYHICCIIKGIEALLIQHSIDGNLHALNSLTATFGECWLNNSVDNLSGYLPIRKYFHYITLKSFQNFIMEQIFSVKNFFIYNIFYH